MDVKVGHAHGWVFGLAGLATFGLLVSTATVGHGKAVPRPTRSGPSVTATARAIRPAARPASAGTVARRATHARAVSAPARPSASCRNGYVALTFDDGPDPVSTPRLLAALRRAELRATFFDVGERVAEYPQLARQTVAYGTAVEDHTWDHRSLTGASTSTPALTARQVIAELDRAKQAIASRLPAGGRSSSARPTATPAPPCSDSLASLDSSRSAGPSTPTTTPASPPGSSSPTCSRCEPVVW